ncbi:MAG: hypothetical protein HYY36_07625 [Gammaproteobacteria bacterium]|nr:hypothetical protein [Gammaproteobacteria bacterium]
MNGVSNALLAVSFYWLGSCGETFTSAGAARLRTMLPSFAGSADQQGSGGSKAGRVFGARRCKLLTSTEHIQTGIGGIIAAPGVDEQ